MSDARARVGEVQRAFSNALRQPQALDRLLPYGCAPSSGASQTVEAAHRLGLYRGNYLVHMTAALNASFPVIAALLGNTCFEAVARTYGQAQPPVKGDLAWVGENFAAFLAGFEPLAYLPYLPDLAHLEWQLARAYAAPDIPPVKTYDLNALVAPDIDAARLQIRAACGLTWLRSAWPVLAIWRAHQLPDAASTEAALAAIGVDAPGENVAIAVWRDQAHRLSAAMLDEPLLALLRDVMDQPQGVWPFLQAASAIDAGLHDYPSLARALAQEVLLLTLEPAAYATN